LAHGFGFDREEHLMRQRNAAGYIMIEGFENLRLTACRTSPACGPPATGHTGVRKGEAITADQAYQDRSLQAADR
jgi:hypothetical protein